MVDKPARKIKNNGTKKNTGYFPSLKNSRSIAYESLLELNYMYLLEFDKDVISFIEQPLTLEYNLLSRKRKYTPDLKVVRKDKTQIIEIKPKEKLKKLMSDSKEKAKFDVAKYYCKENNFEFKFVTDEDIYSGNILKNVKFLFRYSRIKVLPSLELKIRTVLSLGESNIGSLLEMLCNDENYIEYKMFIYSLIYEGVLKIDLSMPITDKTILTL